MSQEGPKRHVRPKRKCPVRAEAGGVGRNRGAEEVQARWEVRRDPRRLNARARRAGRAVER